MGHPIWSQIINQTSLHFKVKYSTRGVIYCSPNGTQHAQKVGIFLQVVEIRARQPLAGVSESDHQRGLCPERPCSQYPVPSTVLRRIPTLDCVESEDSLGNGAVLFPLLLRHEDCFNGLCVILDSFSVLPRIWYILFRPVT